MGKSSQAKGRRGEIEFARTLQEYGIAAEPGRAVSFGDTPDVTGIPGVHPEIKRVERLNISAAMKQAVMDAEKFHDGIPVLFHRRNHEGWLCTMRLSDWLTLYVGYSASENGGREVGL